MLENTFIKQFISNLENDIENLLSKEHIYKLQRLNNISLDSDYLEITYMLGLKNKEFLRLSDLALLS